MLGGCTWGARKGGIHEEPKALGHSDWRRQGHELQGTKLRRRSQCYFTEEGTEN